jgi:hypothetical protein
VGGLVNFLSDAHPFELPHLILVVEPVDIRSRVVWAARMNVNVPCRALPHCISSFRLQTLPFLRQSVLPSRASLVSTLNRGLPTPDFGFINLIHLLTPHRR